MAGTDEAAHAAARDGTGALHLAPPDHARFPCFDGLRALAAVGILVHHVAFWSRGGLSPVLGPYFAELTVAIYVFFVISGFLLYQPFAAAHLGDRPPPGIRGYLRRRGFRIYPAYWVALVLTLYVLPVSFIDFSSVKETVLDFLLLQRYTTSASIFSGLPQAWTLVVEVSFYLFLPVYAWLVGRIVRRHGVIGELAGIGALIAVGLVTQIWSIWFGVWQPFNVLPYFLSVFALGMLLAVGSAWASRLSAPPRWLKMIGRVAILWWALALVCLVVTTEVLGIRARGGFALDNALGRVWLNSLLGFFLVIPAVFGPQDRSVVRRFLRWRPVAFLGVVSYGIYLWHITATALVRDQWWGLSYTQVEFWKLVVPVFVLTLAFATLSWFVIERPLIQRSRRPLWRRSARDATPNDDPVARSKAT